MAEIVTVKMTAYSLSEEAGKDTRTASIGGRHYDPTVASWRRLLRLMDKSQSVQVRREGYTMYTTFEVERGKTDDHADE